MKKEKKRRFITVPKIILAIILIIILIIAIAIFAISNTLSNMMKADIDTSDLAVNDELYDELTEYGITKKEFDSIINIAFFGSDSRDLANMNSGRADTIMVISVNPIKKSIKMISIPRDTYVSVPGHGKTKINHSYAYGQEQLAIKTINSNFGLNITEYVTINFEGLINVINAVGGVDINISKEERDVLNEYLKDSYKIMGKEYVPMTEYGDVHLNGEQALAHCRDRYVGSDFTRAERQREVLTKVMEKVSQKSLGEIMDLADIFLKQVRTNINVTEYLGMGASAFTNMNEYMSNIISAQVPSTDYGKGDYIDGVYYFVADLDTCKKDMYDYIYNK